MAQRQNESSLYRRGRPAIQVRFLLGPFLSFCLLTGCISQSERIAEDEREALIEAYRVQSANYASLRSWREANKIRLLKVVRDRTSGDLFLSVDLLGASLEQVLAQIFSHPFVQYKAKRMNIAGRVSAKFYEMALPEAVDLLLEDTGYAVETVDNLITLVPRNNVLDAAALAEQSQVTTREVRLRHLSAPDGVTLVLDLFGDQDTDEDDTAFAASAATELNTLYLTGTAQQVEAATRILNNADQPVAHVIIEALVVDLDITAIEELGISLSDGATGSYGSISVAPGSIGSNVVASFEELAMNTEQLTATIDLLASLNTVEILSRPYLATRSTYPATIEIVDDQYVRVDTSEDGASIVSAESVTAGISMGITPTVMADGTIRMDITLEESKFAATFADAIITKERNSSATSMSVHSGQTIVIGGLNSQYRSTANAGLPWLRKITILNFFTGSQSSVGIENQLVVYLTPYIWTPGLDTPMPRPGTLRAGESVLTEIEQVASFDVD